MKLLILTQKIDKDDPILGFFHRWVEEFSKHCESVILVCLFEGRHNLPDNVKVFSLGKESGISKFKYLKIFYRIIFKQRSNYDSVFVHMNPIYVCIGGLFWRLLGKKIGLWYAHKSVDTKLRIAEKLSDIVFTPSIESFRIKSKKVIITGHGIDVDKFSIADKKEIDKNFTILSVGRISPIKNYEILIEATKELRNKNIDFRIIIIGGFAGKYDESYFKKLKDLVFKYELAGVVDFVGSVPHEKVIKYYKEADVFVNLSNTGSLDKAVLEAMACGVPVITSNEGLFSFLYKDVICGDLSAEKLSDKIIYFKNIELNQRNRIGEGLREEVANNYNIEILIPRIINIFYEYGNIRNKRKI